MTETLINALSLNADLLEKIAALQAECAALYQAAGDAQVERDAAREERDALKAECDALRADAERHRFAREEARYEYANGYFVTVRLPWPNGTYPQTSDYFDAAIDNERSKA